MKKQSPQELHLELIVSIVKNRSMVSERDLLVETSKHHEKAIDLIKSLLLSSLITENQFVSLSKSSSESIIKGDYITSEIIGSGAMGTVYKAINFDTAEIVALKIVSFSEDQAQFKRRFERECLTLSKINHSSISKAITWDLDAPQPWLAMELCQGTALSDYIKTHGPLPEYFSLSVIKSIAEGLDAITAETDIVHRDIKPDNIIIQTDNDEYPDRYSTGTSKLIDFGIVKGNAEDSSFMTLTGIAMGTPAYMATEQIDDASTVDLRADVFALGSTLYHMLTGIAPYEGKTALSIINKRKTSPPPDPADIIPGISDKTRNVTKTAMADDKNDRYVSHTALVKACDSAMKIDKDAADSQKFLRKPLTAKTAKVMRKKPAPAITAQVQAEQPTKYKKQESDEYSPETAAYASSAAQIQKHTQEKSLPNYLDNKSSKPATEALRKAMTEKIKKNTTVRYKKDQNSNTKKIIKKHKNHLLSTILFIIIVILVIIIFLE